MSRLPHTSLAYALLQAARIDAAVFAGQSLADGMLARVDSQARPAVQDLVYGSLRQYGRGDFFLAALLDKPLADVEVHALLLVALYRLETRPDATHTVVDQAVVAAGELARGRFRGLVNAVLRNFLRRQAELTEAAQRDPVAAGQHPAWWLEQLQKAYPNEWQGIAEAGNGPPPMALRVNCRWIGRWIGRDDYLQRLQQEGIGGRAWGRDGIVLDKPLPVDRLPGFDEGWVSVQDRKSTRLNSSHLKLSRMPSSA